MTDFAPDSEKAKAMISARLEKIQCETREDEKRLRDFLELQRKLRKESERHAKQR